MAHRDDTCWLRT